MAEPLTQLVDQMVQARDKSQGQPRGARIALARGLGEHGVLSRRQIGLIVDEHPIHLQEAVQKESKHGGRYEPESLDLLHAGVHRLARGKKAEAMEDFYRAWRMGTSLTLMARLSGLTLNSLKGRMYAMRKAQGDE